MAQRNPAREIAFSLLAAVLLGGGLFVYLKNTIPKTEVVKASTKLTVPSAEAPTASMYDRASSVVQRFLDALREKRFRDAHAMTLRAYQNAVSVAEFQAAIEASPYMATAKEVSFERVNQQTMKREDGTVALGPVMGRGMLISDHGTADVSITLTPEEGTLHVLTVIAAGVPIFKGMVATP